MKYITQIYTKYFAYTSYPNLSLEAAKAIEDSCFDEIPNILKTELGSIELFDGYGHFVPSIEAYENPGKTWIHNKRSDWYAHVPTGVKVKKEVKKSPNYDKWNGEGSCTTTLTVRIPLPDGRGKNPNSHHNKPAINGKTRDIKLTDCEWEKLQVFGEGKGYSQGIRNLLKYSSGV